MTQIIMVCFIVGLALIMTIRWLRKKVSGDVNDCCIGGTSSQTFSGCNPASRGGITNKTNGSIDCSFPRERG
ncbi:MAG: hypothetical protein JRJ86_10195 [Deltaproteobacteria bacterium]|nr:hypothetical protein [Deltaproteobacteria bacterium]HDH97864.1 hypothetical protein [Deltaproteobacteria bacterium]